MHHLLEDVPPLYFTEEKTDSWEEQLRLLMEQLPSKTSSPAPPDLGFVSGNGGVFYTEGFLDLGRLRETWDTPGRHWENSADLGRGGKAAHWLLPPRSVRAVLGSFI